MTLVSYNYKTQKVRDVIDFNVINAFVNCLVSGDSVCLARRKVKLQTGYSAAVVKHVINGNIQITEILKNRISKRLSTKTRWK